MSGDTDGQRKNLRVHFFSHHIAEKDVLNEADSGVLNKE